MNHNLMIAELKDTLKAQIVLADKIYRLQRAMYEAVMSRDWLESEKYLQSIEQETAHFTAANKKRSFFFDDSVRGNGKTDFFELVRPFPEKEKAELEGLYNSLKEKLYFSKIENDSFSAYISHAKSLVQGMVDIICEDRGGTRYTHTGKRVNVDMTSLVLNEVL